jgi:hypothetical protein
VVEAMKAMPTKDPLFGDGMVRKDGRVIHNMYLFEVKSPEQSKGPWDYYNLKRTVPAADAFRPDQPGWMLAGVIFRRPPAASSAATRRWGSKTTGSVSAVSIAT